MADLLVERFAGDVTPTLAEVETAVHEMLVGPFAALKPSAPEIVDSVLKRVKVKVGSASILSDDKDHEEWLEQVDRTAWRLSPRLFDYLMKEDHIPPAVVTELDRSTDQALKHLEGPQRAGRWDRRGMVVGLVQSGKTTHYTTLASKALDAGYQLVIILAGIHNNLRSQTHERIDKYLIGYDSAAFVEQVKREGKASKVPIGVGQRDLRLGRDQPKFSIVTCTTSADDGDFVAGVANKVGGLTLSDGLRMVMVVKKNVTVLRNLSQWLRAQNIVGDSGKAKRIDAPTLVIDDEADHASINTERDPEEDPTKVNRLIRELLCNFNRVSFVGYTATPFANIFIPPEEDHPEFGPDLFPKSFIVNLKPPSDYVGPDVVFGHPGDESANIPEKPPLPMHVTVGDFTGWIPDKHKKGHNPGPLPESLKEAIRLFVLVCAARRVRGKVDVHNSMLVHATRFTLVQDRVTGQVKDVVSGLLNILGSGSEERVETLRDEFHDIWTRRIADVHGQFEERLLDASLPLPAWDRVWAEVHPSVSRLEVMAVHGESDDALAYSRRKEGLYVIAIGGDKLSRGLTLEGLSVSYFLRTSKMFDSTFAILGPERAAVHAAFG
jgi:hypothetical protein